MISDIIKTFKLSGGVTIERRGKGSYNANGFYTWGASVDTAVTMVAGHPSTGKVLQQLPEGTRSSDAFTFYFEEEVRTAIADTQDADVIVYGGLRYVLNLVEDWSARGGFWVGHGILTRTTQPEPA